MAKEKEIKSKIRIRLSAYDHKVIDTSARQIIDTAVRYGSDVLGPTPLPTEIKKYSVNRSTFVYNKSKEQYEIRIHKRIIDILNPGAKVLDALRNLTLPAGVNIEIKM
jgi:small subunit ribosomal protein S10